MKERINVSAQNSGFNPESILLVGKACINLVDFQYEDHLGETKQLRKGRKLTIYKILGNRFVLRWGTKMFLANRSEFEIL